MLNWRSEEGEPVMAKNVAERNQVMSVSLAFLTMWLVSKADSSDQATADRESFRVMEEA